MRTRCNNKQTKDCTNYGGRGIQVCKTWNHYEAFAKWAISNGYADNLTIERKNNNRNYTPSNCCFIPHTEQASNKRPFGLSKYKGISCVRRDNNPWYFYVGHQPERKTIHGFKSELAAYRARNKYLQKFNTI